MKCLVSFSSHSPSLNDIWFKDITSKDKLEIVFSKFLLKANANYPLAALFTFIISSVSPIFIFKMSMMLWYCSWMLVMSFSVYLRTVPS